MAEYPFGVLGLSGLDVLFAQIQVDQEDTVVNDGTGSLRLDAKWRRKGKTLYCTGHRADGTRCRQQFPYESGGVKAPEICPGCGSFMINTQRAEQRRISPMVKAEAGA